MINVVKVKARRVELVLSVDAIEGECVDGEGMQVIRRVFMEIRTTVK